MFQCRYWSVTVDIKHNGTMISECRARSRLPSFALKIMILRISLLTSPLHNLKWRVINSNKYSQHLIRLFPAVHIIDNGVVGSLGKDKTKTDGSSPHKQILTVTPLLLHHRQHKILITVPILYRYSS